MTGDNLFLSKDFARFIAPDCDRLSFITHFLEGSKNISSAILPVAGFRHIYAAIKNNKAGISCDTKTIVAHYDRVQNTYGANDNSAAVFMLLYYLKSIEKIGARPPTLHNLRVIFTDGEEAMGHSVTENDSSPIGMGSYHLAKLFERVGIAGDDIFVFDCMGRGDVPVLQKVTLPKDVDSNFSKKFNALYTKAKRVLCSATANNYAVLPTGYSDNASFFSQKIAAVNITMLPKNEVIEYKKALIENPLLEKYVVNKKNFLKNDTLSLKNLIPKTWQLLHSTQDGLETLTAQSVAIFFAILDAILL